MYPKIKTQCLKFQNELYLISEERQLILKSIADALVARINSEGRAALIYICTHNSRRSHFGQIWANVLAEFYEISASIKAFSGGTEVTALHPNSIQALRTLGFQITSQGQDANPIHTVSFGEGLSTDCFSKIYDDSSNPQNDFFAVMTCSHADQNCPFIPGAAARFSTPYEDPKRFDSTPQVAEKYMERCLEIGLEITYMLNLVDKKV